MCRAELDTFGMIPLAWKIKTFIMDLIFWYLTMAGDAQGRIGGIFIRMIVKLLLLAIVNSSRVC